MPLGKRTVPVSVPIGIGLRLPNGSHWNAATSRYRVVAPTKVIVTSNLRLSASVVAGMFQPISTVFSPAAEPPEPRIGNPSVRGSKGCGSSALAVTSAMYQCPA